MSGEVIERAVCDMRHPQDLQTVLDLAESLNANEPAVVVSLGGGRMTCSLGGPDLPPELLEELLSTVARWVGPPPGATRQ